MVAAQVGSVPVLILKEGTQRTHGREAQRINIMAAITIAEAVKSTLGPKGMDKMLVDTLGDVTITNDGATILGEIEVQHPAAKIMVEVSKTQDEEVGDGTTTSVVLAGELLKKAEELIEKNIHPTLIVQGYKKATEKAIETLEKIAIPVDINNDEMLRKVAYTSMNSKASAGIADIFADMVVKAVKQIAEKRGEKYIADIDYVQVVKKQGGSVNDSLLVYGVIVDKEVVHPGMPKKVQDAKIALLDCPLEIEKTEIDAEIRISDPTQMKAFIEEEGRMLKEMVNKIKAVGANVVFCQKGIDDLAQHYLAKEGIMALRRVKKSDMEKLARATGARIVTNLDDLTPADLGYAKLVEERRFGEDKLTFVEGCKDPRAVSILIRGGLQRVVDEAERTLHDALCTVSDVIEEGKVVAGGGAPEMEIARALREYATSIGGREQLAIEAFADSIEVIPRTLAENAGLDPIDIIVELRSRHEKGEIWAGVDVISGKVANMLEKGVIEPLVVKTQAIKSATEACSMILRIDDVIAAAKTTTPSKTPEKTKEETGSELD
ncbi:MAG: thermosome subunit [Candidatus Methanomethylicota archaeon]|jgi:thermosome|uniref:Thermosome subunit n=1 Tax=Thermoproteota archaeon TaxID=2056631 RepID=A0A520KG10_9CREN|nr:MAG: thermosome subunit [Candidatus Verstraetearchaeota archaeon]TDA37630.1 MAG: thermosome subunit [Candidatus Verstraetearchaeota archaeon]